MPVPLKARAVGESEASLANDTLCDAEPLVVGANVIEKETLSPVKTVSGNETPLMENGALTEGADAMVTLASVAVKLAVCVWWLPISTFPKLIEVGEIESKPCGT